MKTKMAQLIPAKKQPPRLARHRRHIKGVTSAALLQIFEEGYELGRQRKLGETFLVALGSKPDDFALEINIRKVNASLTEPASLVPRYEVRDAHPLGLFQQKFKDFRVLGAGDTRFSQWPIRLYIEPVTGVNGSEPASNGFAHDNS